MIYRIEFSQPARKTLLSLPHHIRNVIEKKIDRLAGNPRPPGFRKLSGEEDLYRIRSGDYRILYQIRDQLLTILVVRIGDRKEVYRHL